ncbi:MAG: phosphoglycerate kinase [Bacteriovorax sp. MedPE-SWde]|nr:MAG: phosphoglycerate kinase [Bacteriovorax sp. MedPE-SWde]
MAIQYIDSVDLTEKNVVARFDFNVPLDKNDSSKITDTTRIDNALETIRTILDNGAQKLVLISHLGRPKGKVNKKFSLEPVATYLAEKLGEDVVLSESCLDRGIKTLLTLNESRVILLENVRFHAEETKNDRDFARKLSEYGDVYVNDAFGTAHRKHSSTFEINAFFKRNAYAGSLIRKELEALDQIVEKPKSPFVAILGGAKVSDKIKVIESLLPTVSHLLIGGAMAYPFLKAKGYEVGTSLCSDEDVALATKILKEKTAHKIELPHDHIASKEFGGEPIEVSQMNMSEDVMGLDIGPKTVQIFSEKLRGAKTVLWNGPMGMFENDNYNKGTFGVAQTLAEMENAFTLVGGGDSVSAVNQAGLADKMSHVSTGGGASLEYIEKSTLPGIHALRFGIE